MKIRIKLLVAFLLLFTIIISCRRNNPLPTTETVDDTTTVTSTIKGVVVNENNIPVMGATVTLGSTSITTNAVGQFEFRNQNMSANNAHVKVVKPGYFNGNRTLQTKAGRTQLMRIKLVPKSVTGTVNATSGGAVTLPSGGKATFPANAFIDANGTAFTGSVNVSMAWINPTSNDLGQTVPGDLRGITTTGAEQILETYGMLGVDITSTSGQQLKLSTGKTAEIRFPIPNALQSSAPASIPLWDFNETQGRWKEEGVATKIGNEYVGNVSHFSFWNCDVPANFVNLCVTVLGPNNQPLNNAAVRIRRASTPGISATGYTDSTGTTCGAVFKNEVLVLEVLDRCGNVVYTQNIGPYSANASVTINASIPATNMVTITGTVINCNNAAVTNGSVLINTGGAYSYTAPVNATGSYSVTVLNCNNTPINYTVLAVDYTTLQQSNIASGAATSGNVNVGTLQACGTNAAEYIQATIDGTPYIVKKPNDSINVNIVGSPNINFTYSTNISGFSVQNGTSLSLGFLNNNSVGSYSLLGANVVYYNNNVLMPVGQLTPQLIISNNPQVNLTAFGSSGIGFIEGHFSTMLDFGIHPIVNLKNVLFNFRVRRP